MHAILMPERGRRRSVLADYQRLSENRMAIGDWSLFLNRCRRWMAVLQMEVLPGAACVVGLVA